MINNKEVKKIVNKLIKNEDNIMDVLGKISNSEMIKIKANIIGKAIHCDKWVTIVISFIVIAISIAGVLYSQKENALHFLLSAYLIFAVIVTILHMYCQMKKEDYT